MNCCWNPFCLVLAIHLYSPVNNSRLLLNLSPAGMRAYDMSRYRTSGEPTQPSAQQPPSSQPDSYSQVPKTHRVMTLADHISVRCVGNIWKSFCADFFTIIINGIIWHFHFMQHIITQDFARNQDPTPVPSTASATFQTVMPPASSSGRVKVPSRYSPENQGQGPHHQRPSSRVSPENVPDKTRARCSDHPFNLKWVRFCLWSNNYFSLPDVQTR